MVIGGLCRPTLPPEGLVNDSFGIVRLLALENKIKIKR